jgi:hypothetical protein
VAAPGAEAFAAQLEEHFMITRDEALARARTWAAEGKPDGPPEISLHEFDLGWVAWSVRPAPSDATERPPVTGGQQIVIDRETGEISRWPSLPAEVIAKQYATTRAAEDRFPPDVRRVLDEAGWFPGRDISAAVDQWEIRYAETLSGLPFFPIVRAALCEFGGLVLPQYGRSGKIGAGFTSYLHPTGGGVGIEAAQVFADEYDNAVFPIGNSQDGPAEIVMDQQGRVFFLHWAEDFFVGAGIDAALIALIRGNDDWAQASDRTW